MKDNWMILTVAILRGVPMEQAANLYYLGRKELRAASKNQFDGMRRMKEGGYTWKEVGEAYGLSAEAAYRRVKRHKEGSA